MVSSDLFQENIVNKKKLEILLQKIPGFTRPSKRLEQYTTPTWLVAEIINEAYLRNDLKNKVVADLGCGTGRISIAAALSGAERIFCIDISCRDLEKAYEYSKIFGIDHLIDFICWDLEKSIRVSVDTTIMNPPFGVYRRGYDILFLRRAYEITNRSIYSIHKYNKESLDLINRSARENGFETRVLGIYDMEIPAVFETHRRRIYRFKVAVMYFRRIT